MIWTGSLDSKSRSHVVFPNLDLSVKVIRGQSMFLRSILVFLIACHIAGISHANDIRPYRGDIRLSVILCKYKDAASPTNDQQFYKQALIEQGQGGLADYIYDISDGSITFEGSQINGWYELDQTEQEARAYGGGGSPQRGQKIWDCVNKAAQQGYHVPPGNVIVVVTSPSIDGFGSPGRVFMGEGFAMGFAAHEIGHAIGLKHSYTNDFHYCNANWAKKGEYGDRWDLMSYGNVFTVATPRFGNSGPRLNAYQMDRMGWLAAEKILRFGADGDFDKTVTLTASSRPEQAGYRLVRIPFDATDLNRYYTVEYRVAEGWDAGIGTDRVLIHEIENHRVRSCSDGPLVGGPRTSYLQQKLNGGPVDSNMNRNGVRIETLSTNPVDGTAEVRIRSLRPARCTPGRVWRAARSSDRVCVTPRRRADVREENRHAEARRDPNGGEFGPDTCKQGFVWRGAYAGDRKCVPPSSRAKARNENAQASQYRIGNAVFGPNTCRSGFVWRRADNRDWVCVTSRRRSDVRIENMLAESRRSPNGGNFGPDTCLQGFVWREAFPGDRVCVTHAERAAAQAENQSANSRLDNKNN
ncbi:MAG: hypothetical protein AAF408_13230 [Pseudomonadota bacterium]